MKSIIKNDVDVLRHWQAMGSKLFGTGGGEPKKTMAELLQGKEPVLYRRGKNGYVQVIFRDCPVADDNKAS